MEPEYTTKLREASGHVESSDSLVEFLYLLMRDHLPVGTVEALVIEIESSEPPMVFTNGWLAKYAENLSKRIQVMK